MKFTLVYDADCGPCTRFTRTVAFLDAKRLVSKIGLVEADSTGLLAPVPESRRHRSFHLISADGRVWSGAAALPKLVSLLPGGWLPSEMMGRNPLVYRASSFVYSVFSRLHDSGSCRYSPGAEARTGAAKLAKRAHWPVVEVDINVDGALTRP